MVLLREEGWKSQNERDFRGEAENGATHEARRRTRNTRPADTTQLSVGCERR